MFLLSSHAALQPLTPFKCLFLLSAEMIYFFSFWDYSSERSIRDIRMHILLTTSVMNKQTNLIRKFFCIRMLDWVQKLFLLNCCETWCVTLWSISNTVNSNGNVRYNFLLNIVLIYSIEPLLFLFSWRNNSLLGHFLMVWWICTDINFGSSQKTRLLN